MPRRFATLDVFTDAALAGNPLAMVFDTAGLDDARMQSIAREFALSETVFVFEPENPVNTAALRIFTPARELPFAGHPTVGAACLIAQSRAPELLAAQDLRIVLEERVGDVVCVARRRKGQALAAYFSLPRLPEPAGEPPSVAALAQALGLQPSDIGFDAHRPSVYSAGVPYVFVPIASLAAMAKAQPKLASLGGSVEHAVYLYSREVVRTGSAFHARMFGAGIGVVEDPATGSAAAAFAAVALAFDRPGDGEHVLTIEQGLEMGRPSFIALGFEVEDGRLRSATIGGSAVVVSQGTLEL